jgi:S-formylglutathione hydrolase FrmB
MNVLALATLLLAAAPAPSALPQQAAAPADTVEWVEFESPRLSAFWGRPITMRAGVVLPRDHQPGERLATCYSVHGFGGSHRGAARMAPRLRQAMAEQDYPRMVYVFLDASFPTGHHEFADSVNNGPWGAALTEEFLPELEARFGLTSERDARLLTGHSSGGWSVLWLQIHYPEVFGGAWSTAPDPVDFRDFTGIDVYADTNAYYDAEGAEIPLVRGAEGNWRQTIRGFCLAELERQGETGGQMASFDAVFSPRGPDGRPMRLWDRETGAIDPEVATSWARYDISRILKERWEELAPALRGRLHLWIGDQDTFRLEGAVKLLQADLEELGSDADVLIVPGRDHGSLFRPHEALWPEGMLDRIHREMAASWAGR